jgi:hypothetical protein
VEAFAYKINGKDQECRKNVGLADCRRNSYQDMPSGMPQTVKNMSGFSRWVRISLLLFKSNLSAICQSQKPKARSLKPEA